MKNYRDSDYALNKYNKGIVYRFADSTVEITLEDYLAENPDRTEQDFLELKALSDEIYLEQVTDENAQTYKNFSLHTAVELSDPTALTPEEQLEERDTATEEHLALLAAKAFLLSGKLTKTQRKRFILYYIKGLSTRQIAELEAISQYSVWECIQSCEKKMKKFLEKYPVTPL